MTIHKLTAATLGAVFVLLPCLASCHETPKTSHTDDLRKSARQRQSGP